MAIIHGIPGEWARAKGTVFGLWPLFLGVFASGFSVALFLKHPIVATIALVLSILFSSWMFLKGLRCLERFLKGARGEEKVSGVLRGLPDGYHVFNDFVVGGRHVDHVVVGPAGVFAIETKCWRGKVTVEDGHILLDGRLPDRSPLSQVLKEARLVKEELKRKGWEGLVSPLLVFASDTFEARIAELQGAVVLNVRDLKGSFDIGREVIPAAELDRLVSLMENNS